LRSVVIRLYIPPDLADFDTKTARWLHSLDRDRSWGHQRRIADKIGVSENWVGRILNGTTGVTVKKLEQIAKHRKGTLNALFLEIDGFRAGRAKGKPDAESESPGGRIIPIGPGIREWNSLVESDPRVAHQGLELFTAMMKLDFMPVANVICLEIFEHGPGHASGNINRALFEEETRCTDERQRKRMFAKYRATHRGDACPRKLFSDRLPS